MNRRIQFLKRQIAAFIIIYLFLVAAEIPYSAALYYVVSFLSLLLHAAYTEPLRVRPPWRTRMYVVIALGSIGYLYYIFILWSSGL